ncbi:hypothetical protein [Dyella japonica]|uniref:hypothetical protein n=1 Tax=Dyella japonica TaxID=231455 RepID=UPI000A422DE7|nr:hypothetical protein [Dyella japonica]
MTVVERRLFRQEVLDAKRIALSALIFSSSLAMSLNAGTNFQPGSAFVPDPYRCSSSPNVGSYLDRVGGNRKVFVLGELHGTNEASSVLFSLVCKGAGERRDVVIGLELPDEAVRQAIVYAKTGDRGALERSAFWLHAKDGRASLANLRLISSLLRSGVPEYRIFGFDIRVTGKEAFGPESAAWIRDYLTRNHLDREATLFLLTGLGHSDFNAGDNSLSNHLIQNDRTVLSISLQYTGGAAWNCRRGDCRPHDVAKECSEGTKSMSKPVAFGQNQLTASYCVGRATASPPAIDALH